MRKLVVISLAFLFLFSSIIPVSASTGTDTLIGELYNFNGVELPTRYSKDNPNSVTDGDDNFYQTYLYHANTNRPWHYIIVKGTVPYDDSKTDYILYCFSSVDETEKIPLIYRDGFVYTRGEVHVTAFYPAMAPYYSWYFFAEDTYSADSYLWGYYNIVWSSDDILDSANQVGVKGDTNWMQQNADVPDVTPDDREWYEIIIDTILDLPNLFVEGVIDAISALLIPDAEYIEKKFDNFTTDLKNKFDIDMTVFETMFDDEKAVEDTNMDYTIPGVGTLNLKVFDASYLQDGVNFFRPIIRGFLVLLLVFYNIRQLIGFFGFDAGVVAGRSDSIAESKKEQRGK